VTTGVGVTDCIAVDRSAAVQVHPSARALADATMLATGAFDPLDRFVCLEEGRRIRDRGQLLSGQAWPAPIVLVLSKSEAAHAAGAEVVELVDAEGAPVAEVSVEETWDVGDSRTAVSGPVRALAPAEHAFARLGRSARQVRAQAPDGGYRAVLLDRPLLASEVSALSGLGKDAPVLLLVRTVDPQVPADVLVKSAIAAAEQIPSAAVVTVPFAVRDDPSDDAALAEVVMRNYGADTADVLEHDSVWRRVERALADDDVAVLGDLLDPRTLHVLRQWRPPRSRRGLVVFFTGLSGSGKSTVARGLVDRLHETDRSLTVLDGDVARRMLSSGLGFSREDRDTNIRRLGWVGAEVARHGGMAVLAPIAPFASTRAEVRQLVEASGDLVLVWISTPLHECERRDRKGLYAKARRGEIPDFTGISSPYEQPDDADLVIDTSDVSVEQAVEVVWSYLVDGGWVSIPPLTPPP
jgi:sulfate adenylyltransferase